MEKSCLHKITIFKRENGSSFSLLREYNDCMHFISNKVNSFDLVEKMCTHSFLSISYYNILLIKSNFIVIYILKKFFSYIILHKGFST